MLPKWAICFFGLLLLTTGVLRVSNADEHPDFSGTWVLDLKASDPPDALLKAQGRSWIERKLAGSLLVTQVISQSEKQMRIKIETIVQDREQVLRLDGVQEVVETGRAGRVKTRSYWSKTGKILLTESVPLEEDRGRVTIRRSLEDNGRTMILNIEMTMKNGRTIRARRVLRKSP